MGRKEHGGKGEYLRLLSNDFQFQIDSCIIYRHKQKQIISSKRYIDVSKCNRCYIVIIKMIGSFQR